MSREACEDSRGVVGTAVWDQYLLARLNGASGTDEGNAAIAGAEGDPRVVTSGDAALGVHVLSTEYCVLTIDEPAMRQLHGVQAAPLLKELRLLCTRDEEAFVDGNNFALLELARGEDAELWEALGISGQVQCSPDDVPGAAALGANLEADCDVDSRGGVVEGLTDAPVPQAARCRRALEHAS